MSTKLVAGLGGAMVVLATAIFLIAKAAEAFHAFGQGLQVPH